MSENGKQIALVIDLDRCIGCRGCQVACKSEHGIAQGTNRIKVSMVGPFGDYPDLQMYFLPKMCQQCEEPACVAVCPTGACTKAGDDGIVSIDKNVCIGCRSCEHACPFDANDYNHELKVMDKCDICADRRARGEGPACARNCPGSAIHFGDIHDSGSDVSWLLRKVGDGVHHLKIGQHHAQTQYILQKSEWQNYDNGEEEANERSGTSI